MGKQGHYTLGCARPCPVFPSLPFLPWLGPATSAAVAAQCLPVSVRPIMLGIKWCTSLGWARLGPVYYPQSLYLHHQFPLLIPLCNLSGTPDPHGSQGRLQGRHKEMFSTNQMVFTITSLSTFLRRPRVCPNGVILSDKSQK